MLLFNNIIRSQTMYKNILASLTLLALTMTAPHIQSQEVDKLILPDGFSIEIYANVRNARQMSLGDDGHRLRWYPKSCGWENFCYSRCK